MSTVPAASHAPTKAAQTSEPTTVQPPAPTLSRTQKKDKSSTAVKMIGKTSPPVPAQKKIPRKSSKPIINWFQRKLAGSGKAKRSENTPPTISDLGVGRAVSNSSRHMGRITSSPLPAPGSKPQAKFETGTVPRRKTRSISLNGDESLREYTQSYVDDDASIDQSLLTRDSVWSPTSVLEADDDASVRPLPPSAPPSPSPSRSSSSYLSDPRTFRSIAASTKPTTVLSIDLGGGGMAHIAQVPPAPPHQLHRISPHVRQSSSLSSAGLLGGSSSGAPVTFAALPNTNQPSSSPNSLRNPSSMTSLRTNTQHLDAVPTVQAPLHTTHHPRNNPRPSSPPLDNASMLTLASSAFGLPGRAGIQNYPPSAIGDSVSQYGGSVVFPDAESTSQFLLGEDERLDDRDFDASVRALRPRSSRRGSWESEASRWSARVHGTGASLARERSVWTTMSVRTGAMDNAGGDIYETPDDQLGDEVSIREKDDSVLDTPLGDSIVETISAGSTASAAAPEDDDDAPKETNETAQKQSLVEPTVVVHPPESKVDARSSIDTIAHTRKLSETGPSSVMEERDTKNTSPPPPPALVNAPATVQA